MLIHMVYVLQQTQYQENKVQDRQRDIMVKQMFTNAPFHTRKMFGC